MANPTLTYGWLHGDDCDSKTGWTLTNSGLVDATHTVLLGDIFQLEGTCNDAGDEFCYIEYDLNPNITVGTTDKFIIRYKTSVGSNGLSAKASLIFTVGTQDLVASGSFSTTWKVATSTITASKTIDKIRFYAQDSPNAVDSGTYQVWYDFLLLHEDTFTFPHVAPGGIDVAFPERHVDIGIPGRGNPITQYSGAKEPITITLKGNMMNPETWGGTKYPYGERFLDAWHLAKDDLFQWFTSDLIDCKVTVRRPVLRQASDSGAQRVWDLVLKQYSLSDIDDDTWSGVQWLGRT